MGDGIMERLEHKGEKLKNESYQTRNTLGQDVKMFIGNHEIVLQQVNKMFGQAELYRVTYSGLPLTPQI